MSSVQTGILSGLGEFKLIAIINTIIGILLFVISIILAYIMSIKGAVISLVIGQLFYCIFNYYVITKKLKLNLFPISFNLSEFRSLLKFSFPIALQDLSFSITSWLIFYSILSISNYGELGLFSAANQWLAILLFLPGVLKKVNLSYMSFNNKSAEVKKIASKMLRLNLVGTFIPVCIIILFSNNIIFMYGPSYTNVSLIINILIISSIFSSLADVYCQAFISRGANWELFFLRLAYQLGLIFMLLLLVNYELIDSAALAMSISYLIMGVFLFFTCKLYFNKIFG